MQIEYERTSYNGNKVDEQDSIQYWIESQLKTGGIESQIKKMQNLLAIVGKSG